MLLGFSSKNFKSFPSFSFSMLAAPKQKGLDYSVSDIKIGKISHKVLSSSVIYGPNAAGKSTIICAIDLLGKIVSRGHIHDASLLNVGNFAESLLALVPNNRLKRPAPVELSADFVENGKRYVYSISIDVGAFMDSAYPRKIVEEKLIVNGVEIFHRNGDSVSVSVSNDDALFSKEIQKNPDYAKSLVKEGLKKEELFLCNGFKNIYGQKIFPDIFNFFNGKLLTFCNSQDMRYTPTFAGKGVFSDAEITAAAKAFGSDVNDLIFIKSKDEMEPLLCSRTELGKVIPAKFVESLGTIRFITLFPAIVKALQTGATLVIDEFDNSIHPMAVMSLVNVFHNDDLNKKRAQLIFNTQNPIYLNNNLFRRDEIKFVDRDENGSSLYSLSDFGTRGTSARKGKNYMENYFVDKYGAIKNIDFSELFEKILEG